MVSFDDNTSPSCIATEDRSGAALDDSAGGSTMIDCENVEFQYPRSSFRLVVESLRIQPGESMALIGPSGSGKTTLLDLIGGVRRPARGRLRVDGVLLGDLSESRRRKFRLERIGYVFQDFELFDHLTVRENILFPAGASGRLRREGDRFAEELTRLAAATGMSNRFNQRTATLSRGEQQRVALCRALVHRPPIVLADEPTGNLDPSNKRVAIDLMRELVSERNATLVIATHDESLLANFDHVIDVNSLGETA